MELPERILSELDKGKASFLDSFDLSKAYNVDHQKIVGAIKSLECLGNVIGSESHVIKRWELTDEGEIVVKNGSHEAVVYSNIPEAGIAQPELMKLVGNVGKVGFSKAMSAGWIIIDKTGGKPIVKRKVDSIEDAVRDHLKLVSVGKIEEIDGKVRDEYKKRKLLHEVNITAYKITKGSEFTTVIEKAATELTHEMIQSGAWKSANFKPYNFAALGLAPQAGHLHPLLKVRAEYRQIFLEMGFSEMPTNNYVESSFWNFDALFQPQQHPARDAHDTFFVSDPACATDFPPEYLEKVKKIHSRGGFGSQGYGYDWKIEEAQKNILRTHTTAVSARMLYKLAQNKEFKPQKYFSIDRVFRNETLDATHLAEFHQIEGLVADYDLTLGDLIGVIYEFFKKLGIEKLRFKPAYNPYTEPSMEIFSYHEGLKKWVEIGNSGIFRPEMLLPMGLPENVNVIAWGLSLERPTMIKYGIDNIRDLVGHKVNLKMVHDNPLCRLDKDVRNPVETLALVTEKRWIGIQEKLEVLQNRINAIASSHGMETNMKSSSATSTFTEFKDIVIEMDPDFPSRSALFLAKKLAESTQVLFSCHVHSTLTDCKKKVPVDFWPSSDPKIGRLSNKLGLTLIWKPVGLGIALKSSPTGHHVKGEVNVARYLSRLLSKLTSATNFYQEFSPNVHWIDLQLDLLHQVSHSDSKTRANLLHQMSQQKRPNNIDNQITLADILYSSMRCCRQYSDLASVKCLLSVPDIK